MRSLRFFFIRKSVKSELETCTLLNVFQVSNCSGSIFIKNDASRSSGMLGTGYQFDCFIISIAFFYKDLFNYENENNFPYTNIYYVIFWGRNSK